MCHCKKQKKCKNVCVKNTVSTDAAGNSIYLWSGKKTGIPGKVPGLYPSSYMLFKSIGNYSSLAANTSVLS
jgi:hypothetical protein